jgi:predicted nucleotidyltransferase component of viral defense system
MPKRQNSAASVRTRLLDLSRKRGESFQLVLTQYANERLLYRLGKSEYKDRFVLKGAMLFMAWQGHLHRPTRDLDLLGYGPSDPVEVAAGFREICEVQADDGITFHADRIEATTIKDDAEYEGVRLNLTAELAGARIAVQIDIGFGDAVVPLPPVFDYPGLLPIDPPVVRAYPREAVIAEKLEAMVKLDIRNSRMKDFYDLWFISRTWPFERGVLLRSIHATFERRKTPLPSGTPFALTDEFLTDPIKHAQWQGFLKRVGLEEGTPPLVDLGMALRDFLLPVLDARGQEEMVWLPGGPWRMRTHDSMQA